MFNLQPLEIQSSSRNSRAVGNFRATVADRPENSEYGGQLAIFNPISTHFRAHPPNLHPMGIQKALEIRELPDIPERGSIFSALAQTGAVLDS